MPLCGISVMPLDFRNLRLSPAGAQPLAFNPYSFPLFASYTMAKRSPPMPFIIGSTTPIAAFAATAASTAFPPRARIAAPACAAKGLSAATIPPREITIDRVCVRSCADAGAAVARIAMEISRMAIAKVGRTLEGPLPERHSWKPSR